MISAALQQHLVGLRVVLLGIHHTACSPVVELIHNLLNREFALHPVEFLCPGFQALITIEVHMTLAVHHLEIGGWQRDAGQTGGQTASEILLVHLLLQGDGRAGVDEVPGHVEVLKDRVIVRIRLTVFFIVKGLQLERLLVDPRTALLNSHGIIQLCVKSEHVELHQMSVDFLYTIHHVLDKLRIRGSGGMHADDNLRFLRLLLVGPLGAHLLSIGIDSLFAYLISSHDRCSKQLKEPGGKRLSAGGIANDKGRVIEPAQFFRTMIEPIGAAGHQCHHQSSRHEHRRWILVTLQPLADVLQQREVLHQALNLLAPVIKLTVES